MESTVWRNWLPRVALKRTLDTFQIRTEDPETIAKVRERHRSLTNDIQLALFGAVDPKTVRPYCGAHAGWDQDNIDPLSRDELLGLVDKTRALVVWTHRSRYYG